MAIPPEVLYKDIPELFEIDLGEALTARTEALSTFRELGPPDLCHVVKSTGRTGQRDLGSYHYVSGVDASSSASLAAYINSLTYAIEENSAWFSSTAKWKVRNGCYCCFNAFSRVDMRVDVKIPGGVNAYVIDLRGERHEATPEIWQETYVSALLRAILYSDDPTYTLEAYRKLDPITNAEGELRFLQAAEALFSKGWQVATVVSNHLTAGIMKYFGDSGRYQQAANMFEKIMVHEPEVSSLLARSYIGMNEEVKAVQIIANAMKETPQSYTLLHAQCDFLRTKGKYEWAVKLARQAVNCAPSEFVTWEKLTDLYIDLGQYDSALLTLNSCPMFTFNGRDAHRTLPVAKIHLPFTRAIGEILPERTKTEDDEADPALQRLPAPGLRGTWARAYSLLTRLVAQIGWDELLKTRSSVFVMEEEYRMQKAQGDIKQVGGNGHAASGSRGVIHEDGTVVQDDKASTRGIIAPPSPEPTEGKARAKVEDEDAEEGDIVATPSHLRNGVSALVEKPVQAAGEDKQDSSDITAVAQAEPFSFSNKRLCERWLDNLFMVLYEDLRVWTIFRAEVAHFKTQHVAYRKTGMEWEILGDLGVRLHHKEEAKEAYQRCLDGTRYSVKPWARLMEVYAEEGDAIRVAVYQTLGTDGRALLEAAEAKLLKRPHSAVSRTPKIDVPDLKLRVVDCRTLPGAAEALANARFTGRSTIELSDLKLVRSFKLVSEHQQYSTPVPGPSTNRHFRHLQSRHRLRDRFLKQFEAVYRRLDHLQNRFFSSLSSKSASLQPPLPRINLVNAVQATHNSLAVAHTSERIASAPQWRPSLSEPAAAQRVYHQTPRNENLT
ncbi:Chs5p-Arf1p-binding proteins-domain-containing protein [Ephemerocybe angulata]|uniref:Chs5p-Arf1p-binding proteins-domain-containing protein n=1 Tax=Ephemerocybe angulata TaxID=980116 RepID=A0A8H6LUX8_9AGAR|nr:Chs5p-Arf1p-binding proteins-domain-containing protein [Tulosesus angulatus]